MGAVGNSDIINWYTGTSQLLQNLYKFYVLAVAQVAGGGASAAGVSGAGGSGGGGSPYETVCIPAILLPSVLFIKPGFGDWAALARYRRARRLLMAQRAEPAMFLLDLIRQIKTAWLFQVVIALLLEN